MNNLPSKALVIGASTGGSAALQKIIPNLPKQFQYPILIIQHMPAAFTSLFAERLNALSQITVKEAENGEVLCAGKAYVAPGGKHMFVKKVGKHYRLRVSSNCYGSIYKPSVDLTFTSASQAFGKNTLGVVLTGMGADGREGSRRLKAAGATIWTQDEASCVVYGMPRALDLANLSCQSVTLQNMAKEIVTHFAKP